MTRPLRHGLAGALLRALALGLRVLPLSISLTLGAVLGRLVSYAARGETRRMRTRLEARLGIGAARARRIAIKSWESLGRRLIELLIAERVLPLVQLTPTARARLDLSLAESRAQGQGLLCMSAHFGNWELLAAHLAAEGYPFKVIAAAPKQSPLIRWLSTQRRQWGVETLHPRGGARAGLRHLLAGGQLATLIDLSTRERGCQLPLFGAPARCSLTAPRLALRSDAKLLWLWCERRTEGGYLIHCERLPEMFFSRATEGLAAMNLRLETLVKTAPEEWVWLHDRWS